MTKPKWSDQMTDYERGYHQGKADALTTQNPASCINRSDTNPRRPWVGLTDEEIQNIGFEAADRESAVIQAEDKLKEKNGG